MALCGGFSSAAAEVMRVRIPWEMVLSFAIGLGLMCLVGYLLLVPMRFIWRLAAGGVLGALALWLVNAFGGLLGLHVAVNPFHGAGRGLPRPAGRGAGNLAQHTAMKKAPRGAFFGSFRQLADIHPFAARALLQFSQVSFTALLALPAAG